VRFLELPSIRDARPFLGLCQVGFGGHVELRAGFGNDGLHLLGIGGQLLRNWLRHAGLQRQQVLGILGLQGRFAYSKQKSHTATLRTWPD